MSEITEHFIHIKLAILFKKKGHITKHDLGFPKGKSAADAPECIKDNIIANIENKRSTVGLFLHVRKTFDSLKRDVILAKL